MKDLSCVRVGGRGRERGSTRFARRELLRRLLEVEAGALTTITPDTHGHGGVREERAHALAVDAGHTPWDVYVVVWPAATTSHTSFSSLPMLPAGRVP